MSTASAAKIIVTQSGPPHDGWAFDSSHWNGDHLSSGNRRRRDLVDFHKSHMTLASNLSQDASFVGNRESFSSESERSSRFGGRAYDAKIRRRRITDKQARNSAASTTKQPAAVVSLQHSRPRVRFDEASSLSPVRRRVISRKRAVRKCTWSSSESEMVESTVRGRRMSQCKSDSSISSATLDSWVEHSRSSFKTRYIRSANRPISNEVRGFLREKWPLRESFSTNNHNRTSAPLGVNSAESYRDVPYSAPPYPEGPMFSSPPRKDFVSSSTSGISFPASSQTGSAPPPVLPPLGPRSLRLLHLHLRFLWWFGIVILAGLVMHVGKFHQVSSSLSINGYKDLLQSWHAATAESDGLKFSPQSSEKAIAQQLVPTSSKAFFKLSFGNLLALDLIINRYEAMSQLELPDNIKTKLDWHSFENFPVQSLVARMSPVGDRDVDLTDVTGTAQGFSPNDNLVYSRADEFCRPVNGVTVYSLTPAYFPFSPRLKGPFPTSLIDLASLALVKIEIFAKEKRPFVPMFLKNDDWQSYVIETMPSKPVSRQENVANAEVALQEAVITLAVKHPKLIALLQSLSQRPDLGVGASIRLTEPTATSLILNQFRKSRYQFFAVNDNFSNAGFSGRYIWAFRPSLSIISLFDSRLFSPIHRDAGSALTADVADLSFWKQFWAEAVKEIEKQERFKWDLLLGEFSSAAVPSTFNSTVSENDNSGKEQEAVLSTKKLRQLFIWTSGFLSPTYPFSALIKRLYNRRSPLYIWLILIWSQSLLSPQPVTLVHFPRFVHYVWILVYRYVILYRLCGWWQSRFTSARFSAIWDYSDHIVLYMVVGLIISIELAAAERGHSRQVVIRRPQSYPQRWWRKFLNFFPSSVALRVRRQGRFYRPVQGSLWARTARMLCERSGDQDEPRSGSDENQNLGENRKSPRSKHAEMLSSLRQQDVYYTYAWSGPVIYARILVFSLWVVLCYSGFMTAALFHHRAETVAGVAVGILGLFLPFWLLIWTGVLTMDRLGIPRDFTCCQ